MNYLKGLIGILIILNLFLSSYYAYQDITNQNPLCLTGSSCLDVRNSQYSELFGMKLSMFGVISFLALLIIYILENQKRIPYRFFMIPTILGALFAIYFLSLQFFVIQKVCSTCFIIDSTAILIAIFSIINRPKK